MVCPVNILGGEGGRMGSVSSLEHLPRPLGPCHQRPEINTLLVGIPDGRLDDLAYNAQVARV